MLPTSSVPLATISPTMLGRLACPAQVAFGQSGQRASVSRTAPAVLGVISHRALELVLVGTNARDAWILAVGESEGRGEDPGKLVGLHRAWLRFARQVPRAEALVGEIQPSDIFTETRLINSEGTLEGTPDLVMVNHHGCILVEFKTGLITDAAGDVPIASFARQIQLYAHLASEVYGKPPSRGVLMSARQDAVEVDVSPEAVEAAVKEALAAREAFNAIAPGPQPVNASRETCTWCSHQAYCDGFWRLIDSGQQLDIGQSVKGPLTQDPETSINGLSAVEISVKVGQPTGSVIISQIPTETSTCWNSGDVISLTCLHQQSFDDTSLRFRPNSDAFLWPSEQ